MHDAGMIRGVDVEGRRKRKDGITLILIIRAEWLRLKWRINAALRSRQADHVRVGLKGHVRQIKVCIDGELCPLLTQKIEGRLPLSIARSGRRREFEPKPWR